MSRSTVPHMSPDPHLSARTPVYTQTHQTHVQTHTAIQQETPRGYSPGIRSLSWLQVCALFFWRYVIHLCCHWENRVCAHTPNPKTRSYYENLQLITIYFHNCMRLQTKTKHIGRESQTIQNPALPTSD